MIWILVDYGNSIYERKEQIVLLNKSLHKLISEYASNDFITQYNSSLISQNFIKEREGVSWIPLELQVNTYNEIYGRMLVCKTNLIKESLLKPKQSTLTTQSGKPSYNPGKNSSEIKKPLCTICNRVKGKEHIRHFLSDCTTFDLKLPQHIYRKKCREFHPDTLASKGMSEEFMEFANQEIVKITEAYEAIKKSRA